MNQAYITHLMQEALGLVLLLSAPALLVAMVVGLGISILQAATQIQEQTLTFVPKIIAVVLALLFLTSWLLKMIVHFTEKLYAEIPGLIR